MSHLHLITEKKNQFQRVGVFIFVSLRARRILINIVVNFSILTS